MSRLNLNTDNLSVSNASRFENEIRTGTRPFHIAIGNSNTTDEVSADAGYAREQNNLYKDTSVFRRMPSQNASVVVENIEWNNRFRFDTWKSDEKPTGNYYCNADDRIYLIVQNDMFNRSNQRMLGTTPSILPTHTYGWAKYDDYAYLYISTLDPVRETVIQNDDWIHVPDIFVAGSEGALLYQSIDLQLLTGIYINKKHPDIPILSDTGTNAEIRLVTAPASSPDTTESSKQYKIVGLQINSIGRSYEDFDLESSLSAVLTKETTSTITALTNAISIGFSPSIGFKAREVLQAANVIVTSEISSDDITRESSQTSFNRLSLVEGLEAEDGEELPTTDGSTIFNSIKIQISAVASVMTAAQAAALFTGKPSIQNTNKKSKDVLVASSITSTKVGSLLQLEVNTFDRKEFTLADTFNINGSTQKFEVEEVTLPIVKRSGATPLNTKKINFTVPEVTDSQINRKEIIQSIIRF